MALSGKQNANADLGALATITTNDHIRSLRYFPTRLPNAQLQALTT